MKNPGSHVWMKIDQAWGKQTPGDPERRPLLETLGNPEQGETKNQFSLGPIYLDFLGVLGELLFQKSCLWCNAPIRWGTVYFFPGPLCFWGDRIGTFFSIFAGRGACISRLEEKKRAWAY